MWEGTWQCEHGVGKRKKTGGVYIHSLQVRK
jgi:hypothetical protein